MKRDNIQGIQEYNWQVQLQVFKVLEIRILKREGIFISLAELLFILMTVTIIYEQ